MAGIEGILLGNYLIKKKKYKTIIILESILVSIMLLMFIFGIAERVTYNRLKEEGDTVTATCYSIDREPINNKKYSKRSYWEWEYNGEYYGEDVAQSEPQAQLDEIGKTATVYIDKDSPSTYILETEQYNPNATMLIGLIIFAIFGTFELITILGIIKQKRIDAKQQISKK